jgi:hypothetical protein
MKKSVGVLANIERNQTKSRKVGEKPRASQTGGRMFNPGLGKGFVQLQKQFLPAARGDMTLEDIVPKKSILGTPRVEKESRIGRTHRHQLSIGSTVQPTY